MSRMIRTLAGGAALGAALALLPGAPHASLPPQTGSSPDLEFIVIGDTRPRFASEDFSVFEGLIPRINALRPAFVINLGDLIYGYGLRPSEPQWERYERAVKRFQAPYRQIPGNHDIYSRESRERYAHRFGRTYESFDQAGYHFVLVDNGQNDRWGEIGPEEMSWLEADLRSHRGRQAFVFMHFPVWDLERIDPRFYEVWSERLHPLFRASRVRAVFGGHYHCYGPTRETDGILYLITGGGGAELRPEYERAGGGHHFLRVRLMGDRLDLRIVKGGGELTDAEADVMGGLLFAERQAGWIGIAESSPRLRTGLPVGVTIANPGPAFLEGRASWIYDPAAFRIEPESIVLRIPPEESRAVTSTFHALSPGPPAASLPRLVFSAASSGRRVVFEREVLFLKPLAVPFRRDAPALDGDLRDWDGIPAQPLGDPARPEAEIRARHDGARLYLAVAAPTAAPPFDAGAGFRDGLQVGLAARLGEAEFASDALRIGLACEGAGTVLRDRTPVLRSRRDASLFARVRAVCRGAGGRSIYELEIPLARLGSPRTLDDRRLVLNLSYPAEPPEGAPAAAPKPNSVSFQIRYGGGDNLVPVHFLELILGPER